MQIEAIRLKNFRAFHDVSMRDIPRFCVLVGANGSGKSTLFSVFAFLRDAMTTNVTAVVAIGNLIENWHLSEFHISRARPEAEAGYAEHLSREGENLSLVVEYLYKNHPAIFQKILNRLKASVPGISKVEAKTTEEGRVLLKFQDGAFQGPFFCSLCFRRHHQDVGVLGSIV